MVTISNDEGSQFLAFSPDNKFLANDTTADEGKSYLVQLRDSRTGKLKRTFTGGGPLAFTPDGKTLIGMGGKSGKQVMFWPM